MVAHSFSFCAARFLCSTCNPRHQRNTEVCDTDRPRRPAFRNLPRRLTASIRQQNLASGHLCTLRIPHDSVLLFCQIPFPRYIDVFVPFVEPPPLLPLGVGAPCYYATGLLRDRLSFCFVAFFLHLRLAFGRFFYSELFFGCGAIFWAFMKSESFWTRRTDHSRPICFSLQRRGTIGEEEETDDYFEREGKRCTLGKGLLKVTRWRTTCVGMSVPYSSPFFWIGFCFTFLDGTWKEKQVEEHRTLFVL